MNPKEFQDLHGKPAAVKQSMTAAEWREMMKKKAGKKSTRQVDEIRLMLKLARIDFAEEHKFHPTRKWRFDFAIVDKKIALEYEGLFSEKSGHTTVDGFLKDVEKYNAATLLGWKVLRYTVKNYKQVIEDVRKILTEAGQA